MLNTVRWGNDEAITHDPLNMHMAPLMMSSSMMTICMHLITREWLDGLS